jgi:hypothetical protein
VLKSYEGPLYESLTGINGQINKKSNQTQSFMNSSATALKIVNVFERKRYGGVRMCNRCLRTKPDRCHHCSQCNKCVLKMDHHCPWVANCIGFGNYKYFINLLFYVALDAGYVAVTYH